MTILTNFLLHNKNQISLFPSKLSILSPIKTHFAFFCFPLWPCSVPSLFFFSLLFLFFPSICQPLLVKQLTTLYRTKGGVLWCIRYGSSMGVSGRGKGVAVWWRVLQTMAWSSVFKISLDFPACHPKDLARHLVCPIEFPCWMFIIIEETKKKDQFSSKNSQH